jgi:hypothetical protein
MTFVSREPARDFPRSVDVKRRGRLLVVLLGAGLTALAGCTSSASAWRTYRHSPGSMHLSYRYPASWQVAGGALVSTMGWVGRAELCHVDNGRCYLPDTVPGMPAAKASDVVLARLINAVTPGTGWSFDNYLHDSGIIAVEG